MSAKMHLDDEQRAKYVELDAVLRQVYDDSKYFSLSKWINHNRSWIDRRIQEYIDESSQK